MAKVELVAGLGVKPGGTRLSRKPVAGEKGGSFTSPDFLFIRIGQTKLPFKEKFLVICRKTEKVRDGVRAHKMENLFKSFFTIEGG